MIIPVRCFTCGSLIGNKWEIYLEEVKKINEDVELSEEDKINKTIDLFENKLKLKRYCCRMILTCTVDMTEIII
tara:strand:- start:341 stop:562 length:222 start_codon:yes stop_codon:yes gene_type:complete